MSRMLHRLWIAAALALVLGVVGSAIASKERIRRAGVVVFLPLAPVDPRSLMQGDYMALRFALADDIARELLRDGGDGSLARLIGEGGFAHAPVRLDERGVGSLAAGDPSALRFRYRLRGGRPWLGTNAFFFQEGQASRYREARYGEFRLDRETGEAVLVALRADDLRPL
jgi:uncharacterized membrane-anchored protein